MEIAGPVTPAHRLRRVRRWLPLLVGLAILFAAAAAFAVKAPQAMRFDDRTAEVHRLERQLASIQSSVVDLSAQVPAITAKVEAVERHQEMLSKELGKQRKTIDGLRSRVKDLKG
jgi:peptidoglycan hydrolase CwlO-like protein